MNLIRELRANRRLRLGLAAIVSILWVYGLLELHDQLEVRRADYKRAAAKVLRQQAQAGQKAWLERAEFASVALAEAEQHVWTDASLAAGQAQFQDWLKQQLALANAQMPNVRIGDSEAALKSGTQERSDARAQLVQMRAKMEFQGDANTVLAIVAAIEGSPRRVVVDGLVVKALRNEISVSAMLKVVAPAEKPGGGA